VNVSHVVASGAFVVDYLQQSAIRHINRPCAISMATVRVYMPQISINDDGCCSTAVGQLAGSVVFRVQVVD
jgi:hypothetical protein